MQTILRPNRSFAHQLVSEAPDGWILSIREPLRTDAQNAKMWAMLTDVSRARMLGRDYAPDMWKAAFLRSLGHEVTFLLDIDGNPFPYAARSSRLTKSQMADLISFIAAEGDRHGVAWNSAPNTGD